MRVRRWYLLLILTLSLTAVAEPLKVLTGHFRHRPPELMVYCSGEMTGPLYHVIEEAASRLGYRIDWKLASFRETLQSMRDGTVDLAPRVIRTAEREQFIQFIGPVGAQQKNVRFIVPKGQAARLSRLEDLANRHTAFIGGAHYFDAFNDNKQLSKTPLRDDSEMARRLSRNEVDTLIVLDSSSMEIALERIGFADYEYANNVFEQRLDIYYGLSASSANAGLAEQLNQTISQMAHDGTIDAIYRSFELVTPLRSDNQSAQVPSN